MDQRTAATIAALARRVEDTLRPLVRRGERCALVGFPQYGNVGDSAIWLGERLLLERLGARVSYLSDEAGFDPGRLRALVADGPVFVQGGGNLGDLWPEQQAFRERVIRELPTSPVVQLPQSIHFDRQDTLARARAVFGAHSRLTLLVRDGRSLALAQEEFPGARTELCPDAAFALGVLTPPSAPVHDVVSIARRDREAVSGQAAVDAGAGLVTDWEQDDPRTALWRGRVRRRLTPALLGLLGRHVARVYDRLARWRLEAGIRLIASGRVVLTDRLHGHILATLLGVPHVVVDNRYGKLSSFLDAWTGQLPLVTRAASVEESPVRALALLEASGK